MKIYKLFLIIFTLLILNSTSAGRHGQKKNAVDDGARTNFSRVLRQHNREPSNYVQKSRHALASALLENIAPNTPKSMALCGIKLSQLISPEHPKKMIKLSPRSEKRMHRNYRAKQYRWSRGQKRKKAAQKNIPSGKLKVFLEGERETFTSIENYVWAHENPHMQQNLLMTPLGYKGVIRHALEHINIGADRHFKRILVLQTEGKITRLLCPHVDWSEDDLKLMEKGHAPIGLDGKPMELHHVAQSDHILSIITYTTHKSLYGGLHHKKGGKKSVLPYERPQQPSIDRAEFNVHRAAIWRAFAAVMRDDAEDLMAKRLSFGGGSNPGDLLAEKDAFDAFMMRESCIPS